MWPSKFKGDGLHLNLLKKNENFWEYLICLSQKYCGKAASYQKFVLDRSGHEK